MEALGILIGAGLAALSPLIPGLRPVTKAVIKGGMALADAATGIATAAAAGWSGLATEVSTDRTAGELAIEDTVAAEANAPAMTAADEASPVTAASAPAAAETFAGTARDTLYGTQAGETKMDEGNVLPGDDLTRVTGIGPKVEALLRDAGIGSFEELAATDVERLQAILASAGSRYRVVNPETWPEQARLLGEQAGQQWVSDD
jgi:predicted flap endonuclease-1-like 5' DNA nuclease